MFFVLIALTLVSFCFLGSTFVRYTSTGTGSATTQVALWDIDITGGGDAGNTTVSFGKLSSSMAEWQKDQTRTHSTALIKVATIVNKGDVGAKITLSADAEAVLKNGQGEVSSVTGDPTSQFNIDHAKARFTIALYWCKTDNLSNAEQTTAYATDSNITLANKDEAGNTVYIYAVVTWTSLDIEGTAFADALDTWIGENITEVSWGLTCTAV